MLVCAGHQHGINAKLRKQRAEAINAIHRALELGRCLEALEHVVSIEILSPATWRGAECGAVVGGASYTSKGVASGAMRSADNRGPSWQSGSPSGAKMPEEPNCEAQCPPRTMRHRSLRCQVSFSISKRRASTRALPGRSKSGLSASSMAGFPRRQSSIVW